ncbi:MAG: hypothetical protein WBV94_05605 [Blastocatellia bacterium]
MRIKKTTNGWHIESDTSDEYNALAFLIKAMEETYCRCAVGGSRATREDADLASHS